MGKRILTWQEVNEIREKWIPGHYPTRQLAEEYCVAHSTIHDIVSGKTWKIPPAASDEPTKSSEGRHHAGL